MKVFFGYSTRGDIGVLSFEKAKKINKIIEKIGLDLIPKQTLDGRKISKENHIDKKNMHNEEYKKLIDADFGIFEITNPAITLGAQISDMIHMGKPILCLYKNDLYNITPRYILGKESSEYINSPLIVMGYDKDEDILTIIQEFVNNYV